MTPAPTDDNLANLAHTLAGVAPRLRAHDGRDVQITLSADVVRAIPMLPLTTDLGPVNVVLHPVGAPADYNELLDEASTVELDTVPTLIPTVDALLRGLAGGARQPHPDLLARLRRLADARPTDSATLLQPPLSEDEQRADLEEAILETLELLGHPASIRDLLFAMNTHRRSPYKQVKIAAESLTGRGRLSRDKEGTAHRYRLITGSDDQLAQEVADLLTKSRDIERTVARALDLVARDTRPVRTWSRRTPDSLQTPT